MGNRRHPRRVAEARHRGTHARFDATGNSISIEIPFAQQRGLPKLAASASTGYRPRAATAGGLIAARRRPRHAT
jgi:hypothetical protein